MFEKVNTAVIGGGTHGEWSHINPLLKLPDHCNLTMIAENRPERRNELRRRGDLQQVELVDGWEKVLENQEVEAVVVATGDELHIPIAHAAIHAGMHILGEKPLATNREEYEELKELLRIAKANNRVFMPCNPKEFAGPWERLNAFVRDRQQLETLGGFIKGGVGDFGRVLALISSSHYTGPDTKKAGMHGSMAEDKLNHDVMSLLRMVDGIEAFESASMLINTDRRYSATLTTSSGVELHSRVRRTMKRPPKGERGIYREMALVEFEEGSLALDALAATLTLTYRNRQPLTITSDDFKTTYDKMFAASNRHFLECVRDPSKQEITDHMKLLSTIAAIAIVEAGTKTIPIRV